ncbi:hypothetical protein Nepgr_026232 [Nepenthes gracilis]|uniref:Uncharacterized protein n=1 Tax=Nepenthes gracilis TaxID=150966 RepID=A0AAD3Y1W0_NEPGR|nr:hypothetical protein Nepgr_026232 [Nepenthes gracilis]
MCDIIRFGPSPRPEAVRRLTANPRALNASPRETRSPPHDRYCRVRIEIFEPFHEAGRRWKRRRCFVPPSPMGLDPTRGPVNRPHDGDISTSGGG